MRINLILITICLIFISANCYSQNDSLSRKEKMDNLNKRLKGNTDKPIGYFITLSGEKVKIYRLPNTLEAVFEMGANSDYALTAERLFYTNEKREVKKIKQKKISELFVGNNYFTRLKIGNVFGFNRLHQVLVQNDKYILTEYFSNGSFYYYLFDKQNEEFIYKKKKSSNKTKNDNKFAEKYLKPYFKNCPDFISQLNENLSTQYKKTLGSTVYISFMTKHISNMKCE